MHSALSKFLLNLMENTLAKQFHKLPYSFSIKKCKISLRQRKRYICPQTNGYQVVDVMRKCEYKNPDTKYTCFYYLWPNSHYLSDCVNN